MSEKTIKIFLISGKAEHGKDTLANFMKQNMLERGLIESYIMTAKFGDVVKFAAKQFFDWSGEKDEIGRGILQKVGTERGHQIVPGIWTQFISDMILMKSPETDIVLIPDWRFPEEYWDLMAPNAQSEEDHLARYYNSDRVVYDIYCLRVERPNHISALTEEQLKHASETALDDFEFDMTVSSIDEDGLRNAATIINNCYLFASEGM